MQFPIAKCWRPRERAQPSEGHRCPSAGLRCPGLCPVGSGLSRARAPWRGWEVSGLRVFGGSGPLLRAPALAPMGGHMRHPGGRGGPRGGWGRTPGRRLPGLRAVFLQVQHLFARALGSCQGTHTLSGAQSCVWSQPLRGSWGSADSPGPLLGRGAPPRAPWTEKPVPQSVRPGSVLWPPHKPQPGPLHASECPSPAPRGGPGRIRP